MSAPEIVTLASRDSRGNEAGKRRFAVTHGLAVVTRRYPLGSEFEFAVYATQSWFLRVWRRVEDRGYVALLCGDGPTDEQGNHNDNHGDWGEYIGTGDTAEAALHSAWHNRPAKRFAGQTAPELFRSACRDYDSTGVGELEIE